MKIKVYGEDYDFTFSLHTEDAWEVHPENYVTRALLEDIEEMANDHSSSFMVYSYDELEYICDYVIIPYIEDAIYCHKIDVVY